MHKIIELCQSTTSCMLSPNQCAMGWFLIAVLVISILIAFWGYSTQREYKLLLQQIFVPLRFRGREGLSGFRAIYFGIGFFIGVWVLSWIFIIGLTYNFALSYLFAGIGTIGTVWLLLVVYASWVRRCHDLGWSAWEGLFRNNIWDMFVMFRWHKEGVGCSVRWQVFHDKGDPTPNQFGPAPEENIPHTFKEEEIEFPNVWPDDTLKK